MRQKFYLKFDQKKFAPQPKSPGDAYAELIQLEKMSRTHVCLAIGRGLKPTPLSPLLCQCEMYENVELKLVF